jgi:2-phosphosulfolactate phosphatase
VDVFSFTTCVDIATAKAAIVYPFFDPNQDAAEFAHRLGAELAGKPGEIGAQYILSPASLLEIPPGTRLVLPSPNGSALSTATGSLPTFAGCLRNASAVALAAQALGRPVTVIAAGERWPDGSLRPALEDWLGAGAIINRLEGWKSPEAEAAEAIFLGLKGRLLENLRRCSSGRELLERNRALDIELAAALDASHKAPRLVEEAYR